MNHVILRKNMMQTQWSQKEDPACFNFPGVVMFVSPGSLQKYFLWWLWSAVFTKITSSIIKQCIIFGFNQFFKKKCDLTFFKTEVATLTLVWIQSNYFYNPTLPTLTTLKRKK